MKSQLIASVCFCVATVLAFGASASPSNEGPPTGAILDLGGTTISSTATEYSIDFTGAVTDTAITFAFRDDPAFLAFSDVSVVDLTTLSGNLLTNGNLGGGTYTDNGNGSTPVGWTYANAYGASYGGGVESGCGFSGDNCWSDGAVQAYDAISQTISTNVGDNYQITFYLSEDNDSGDTVYSDLSTNGDVTDNGGNGIDVLAYAQAGLPTSSVPEPATWAMMLAGFAALGAAVRVSRRRQALATS
jgi:hypothetical protein